MKFWVFYFFKIFIYLFIYLFIATRRVERKKESQTDYVLSMEPDVGLDLMTLRSGTEVKSRVRCLTSWATQVPPVWIFLCGNSGNQILLLPQDLFVLLAVICSCLLSNFSKLLFKTIFFGVPDPLSCSQLVIWERFPEVLRKTKKKQYFCCLLQIGSTLGYFFNA